jgi:hypothetical protein
MSRGPGKVERLICASLPLWKASSWTAAEVAELIFRHSPQDPPPTKDQIRGVREALHRLAGRGTLYIDPYDSTLNHCRHWRVTGIRREVTMMERVLRTNPEGKTQPATRQRKDQINAARRKREIERGERGEPPVKYTRFV